MMSLLIMLWKVVKAIMDGSGSKAFAELLKSFREREQLSREDLADRIRRSNRSSIVSWESGKSLPTSRNVVLALAKQLKLSESETDRLLLAAHFPPQFQPREALTGSAGTETKVTENYPTANTNFVPAIAPIALPPYIPDEPYYSLPGREQNLERLLSDLRSSLELPIIVIDGLGGTGKTAFTVELARRALRQQIFERIIGESARQELFHGKEAIWIDRPLLDFDFFLDTISRQLDHWEIPTLKRDEKQARLVKLLHQHRYLILIDNLESTDNVKDLIAGLQPFLGRSCALIASRIKIRSTSTRSLSLRELSLEDSLFFLKKEFEQRGDNHPLLLAPRDMLVEIWERTSGNPLVMKLVIAQARILPIDMMLARLRHSRNALHEFIFRQSWESLSLTAQLILIYIGRTVTTTVSLEELMMLQEITTDETELLGAIHQLEDYSLLNTYSIHDHKRYGIHELTRQFINNFLSHMWE